MGDIARQDVSGQLRNLTITGGSVVAKAGIVCTFPGFCYDKKIIQYIRS